MKILIGYPDEAGRGKAVQLGGLEVPDSKKVEAFYDAKFKHRFPKGVKRIELLETSPQEIAIFVGDHVAEEAEAFEQAAERRSADIKAKAKAAQKRATDLQSANKAVRDTAVKRSQAQSKHVAAQQRLADAKVNAEKTESKFHTDRLAAETKLADAAEKEFTAANAAWETAKAEKAALERPETETKPSEGK